MRTSLFCGAALMFCFILCQMPVAVSGQFVAPSPSPYPPLPNPGSLPVGLKFCPAPGADNREFNSSYYAVDARTGQMTRYMDGVPREEPFGPIDGREEVLFVAPPISVENRYVPYPGAAPQMPPPEFRQPPAQQQQAMRQPGEQPRRRPAAARPAPVARSRQPMPQQPVQQRQQAQQRERSALHAYAAPAQDPRAVRNTPPPQTRQQREDGRLPWWKKVLH